MKGFGGKMDNQNTVQEVKAALAGAAAESRQVESQISIIDIINMMLTFWWLIVVLAVLVGGGTFAYSKLTSVPQYSSSATVYINTQTEQKTDDVNVTAISNAQELMPTYIEILGSKPFLETISDDIGNKYSYGQIKSMVSYASTTDTNILKISVKSTDSHDAYLIAESISHNAPDEIRRVFEGGSVKLINNAEESTTPLPSNSLKKGLIGFVAGAALAALIIFLINIFDTRVKSSEELSSKYGLPILGEVPNLNEM